MCGHYQTFAIASRSNMWGDGKHEWILMICTVCQCTYHFTDFTYPADLYDVWRETPDEPSIPSKDSGPMSVWTHETRSTATDEQCAKKQ